MDSQHIPSWKRIGLKLKSSGNVDHAQSTKKQDEFHSRKTNEVSKTANGKLNGQRKPNNSGRGAAVSSTKQADPSNKLAALGRSPHEVNGADNSRAMKYSVKRKREPASNEDTNRDLDPHDRPPKPAKIVRFSTDAGDSVTHGKPEDSEPTTNGTDDSHASLPTNGNDPSPSSQARPIYLNYLDDYQNNRAIWKFNKNKQEKLLKNAADVEKVPADLAEALTAYLQGLKGENPRERLRKTALEVVKSDAEDGEIGRAELYEEALRDRLRKTKARLRETQRKEFEESEEFQKRLQKRMRAEEILLALASSDSNNATNESMTISARHIKFDEDDKGASSNTAPGRDVASRQRGPRRQRIRTGVPDDDDSSSSDSDVLPMSSTNSNTKSASGSESSSSEEESDSSSSEESSSDSSDSGVGMKATLPITKTKPTPKQRLNKPVVRDLLNKQNGAIDPQAQFTAKTPAIRKKRPFRPENFHRS